jgi:hypothetical protein
LVPARSPKRVMYASTIARAVGNVWPLTRSAYKGSRVTCESDAPIACLSFGWDRITPAGAGLECPSSLW